MAKTENKVVKKKEEFSIIYEDEIDLFELLAIIWKKKVIVFLVTFFFTLSGFLYILISKPQYLIQAQIHPIILVPQDIQKWFSQSSYQSFLRKKYNNFYDKVKINVSFPRNGKSVFLQMYFPENKLGTKILQEIILFYKDLIENNDKDLELKKVKLLKELEKMKKKIEKLDIEKKEIDRKILELIEKQKTKRDEKKLIQRKIDEYELTIQNLRSLIKEIESNTKNMINLRTKILATNKTKKYQEIDQMTLLLYSNIIQQNISYLSNLELRVLSLSKEKIALQKNLDEIDLQILAIKNEIQNLKQKRDEVIEKDKAILFADLEKIKADYKNLRAFDVIQPPISSSKPVKPKKYLILGICTISGFFLSIFIVFIAHAVEIRKERIP